VITIAGASQPTYSGTPSMPGGLKMSSRSRPNMARVVEIVITTASSTKVVAGR
jgi:hypothetical protein